MERAELNELGYIVPIATVPSMLQYGILSHRRASKVEHMSIAEQEYANLYICPRNPMLRRRSDIHEEICVLRVRPDVLDIPNVIITDSNAATKYVRFRPAPEGLAIVDRGRTFAQWWTHQDDPIEQSRHKAQKCAEVLVPDVVPVQYLTGAYVSCDLSEQRLRSLAPNLPITVDADLFFQ